MSYLVIGLGNPGIKYERTRHNLGFMVVTRLAEELKLKFKEKDNYHIAEGDLEGVPLFIMKPMTYMNLSGKAVAHFLRYKEIADEKIYVVYDDIDMALGKLRLKWNGGSGGHKGVQSIIDERQNKGFFHLKIGISKPPLKELVDGHVLGVFRPEEWEVINPAIDKACQCLKMAITQGSHKAMAMFNG